MLMAESGGGLLEKIVEVVMGIVQRGGKVYLKHVPNTGKWTLLKQIKENISPTARIYSNEYASYTNLPKYGYYHDSVTHNINQYVKGDVHTQNIDNIWSHLKRGIYGVYRVVSPKYLQSYADEFSFRYNHRGEDMFYALLRQIAEVKSLKVAQPA